MSVFWEHCIDWQKTVFRSCWQEESNVVRRKEGELTLFSALSAKLSVCTHSMAADGNWRQEGHGTAWFLPYPYAEPVGKAIRKFILWLKTHASVSWQTLASTGLNCSSPVWLTWRQCGGDEGPTEQGWQFCCTVPLWLLLFSTYLRITRGCSASTDLLPWQISNGAQSMLYVARKLTGDEWGQCLQSGLSFTNTESCCCETRPEWWMTHCWQHTLPYQ